MSAMNDQSLPRGEVGKGEKGTGRQGAITDTRGLVPFPFSPLPLFSRARIFPGPPRTIAHP